MEGLFTKVAEQIPALSLLAGVVWFFLDYMSREAKANREERAAERAERIADRQELRGIIDRNTAAHERSLGMMTHMEHVLRRMDGEDIPHKGSHFAATRPEPRPGGGT